MTTYDYKGVRPRTRLPFATIGDARGLHIRARMSSPDLILAIFGMFCDVYACQGWEVRRRWGLALHVWMHAECKVGSSSHRHESCHVKGA